MAEEQRCQIEGHRLCANNCGFFGNPTTLDLCSKCYRSLHPLSPSATPAPSSSQALTSPDPSSGSSADVGSPAKGVVTQGAGRCAGCKRKVGLTGFRCRCGSTFCGAHRYPEEHACGYDYRAEGREEIARANPVVKAEKLRKI